MVSISANGKDQFIANRCFNTKIFVVANISAPLPPKNLMKVPERLSSIIILWEPPENKSAVKYTLKIIETGYSQEHSCSVAKCAYTVTADDDTLMFNTNYTLEVRTVSMCGVESDPKSISINSGNG